MRPVYYGETEALGEVATPLTPAMVEGKLDRFIYLVIHEDCHDQFDLPYGIEEALCDLLTFKAMVGFAAEKYGEYSIEAWAVRRYVETETARAYATITYYEQLAALYARYERKAISSDGLLRERAVIYKNVSGPLNPRNGELSNVRIANHMTYSRHFPFLEGVYAALGRDLARSVVFFKRVDKLKPSAAAVMKLNRITSQESVQFLRAYEVAVLETIRKALAEARRATAAEQSRKIASITGLGSDIGVRLRSRRLGTVHSSQLQHYIDEPTEYAVSAQVRSANRWGETRNL